MLSGGSRGLLEAMQRMQPMQATLDVLEKIPAVVQQMN